MFKIYKIIVLFVLACMHNCSFAMQLNDPDNLELLLRQPSDNERILQEHISDYATFKSGTGKWALEVINSISSKVRSFFVDNIQDKEVLKSILQSLQNYPDRAVKLYFFCLDRQYRGLWTEKSMSEIEEFIRKLHMTSPHYSFQFITFKHNDRGEPVLAERDWSSNSNKPDIYDIVVEPNNFCIIQ